MQSIIVEGWPMWGLVVSITALLYVLWPSKLLKKNEYVMFFLLSVSTYWLLQIVLNFWLARSGRPLPAPTILLGLFYWVTLTHLIYPFREVKRNAQFTFLSVFFALIPIVILLVAWVAHYFSNM